MYFSSCRYFDNWKFRLLVTAPGRSHSGKNHKLIQSASNSQLLKIFMQNIFMLWNYADVIFSCGLSLADNGGHDAYSGISASASWDFAESREY